MIDGLDEDLNGNGQVDQSETNPRVVDADNRAGWFSICLTRNPTLWLWEAEPLDVKIALPEAVHASRSELTLNNALVGWRTKIRAPSLWRDPRAGDTRLRSGQAQGRRRSCKPSSTQALIGAGFALQAANPRSLPATTG